MGASSALSSFARCSPSLPYIRGGEPQPRLHLLMVFSFGGYLYPSSNSIGVIPEGATSHVDWIKRRTGYQFFF
uniref:Uncharacterized protein n=1 Tax=Picea glauca TaxID=3330 RepID=A0A117NHF8_PICGL|nr:hypothetical protein ABT39_MTgene5322 [Picea glauca]QHR88900.1 hypothetical protein Q903MT_gene2919 [Picea sitchensis]